MVGVVLKEKKRDFNKLCKLQQEKFFIIFYCWYLEKFMMKIFYFIKFKKNKFVKYYVKCMLNFYGYVFLFYKINIMIM